MPHSRSRNTLQLASADLDDFFAAVYRYWLDGGLLPSLLRQFLSSLTILFVTTFTAFAISGIDWAGLLRCTTPNAASPAPAGCGQMYDFITSEHVLHPHGFHTVSVAFLVAGAAYAVFITVKACQSIRSLLSVRTLLRVDLGLPDDAALQAVSWDELIQLMNVAVLRQGQTNANCDNNSYVYSHVALSALRARFNLRYVAAISRMRQSTGYSSLTTSSPSGTDQTDSVCNLHGGARMQLKPLPPVSVSHTVRSDEGTVRADSTNDSDRPSSQPGNPSWAASTIELLHARGGQASRTPTSSATCRSSPAAAGGLPFAIAGAAAGAAAVGPSSSQVISPLLSASASPVLFPNESRDASTDSLLARKFSGRSFAALPMTGLLPPTLELGTPALVAPTTEGWRHARVRADTDGSDASYAIVDVCDASEAPHGQQSTSCARATADASHLRRASALLGSSIEVTAPPPSKPPLSISQSRKTSSNSPFLGSATASGLLSSAPLVAAALGLGAPLPPLALALAPLSSALGAPLPPPTARPPSSGGSSSGATPKVSPSLQSIAVKNTLRLSTRIAGAGSPQDGVEHSSPLAALARASPLLGPLAAASAVGSLSAVAAARRRRSGSSQSADLPFALAPVCPGIGDASTVPPPEASAHPVTVPLLHRAPLDPHAWGPAPPSPEMLALADAHQRGGDASTLADVHRSAGNADSAGGRVTAGCSPVSASLQPHAASGEELRGSSSPRSESSPSFMNSASASGLAPHRHSSISLQAYGAGMRRVPSVGSALRHARANSTSSPVSSGSQTPGSVPLDPGVGCGTTGGACTAATRCFPVPVAVRAALSPIRERSTGEIYKQSDESAERYPTHASLPADAPSTAAMRVGANGLLISPARSESAFTCGTGASSRSPEKKQSDSFRASGMELGTTISDRLPDSDLDSSSAVTAYEAAVRILRHENYLTALLAHGYLDFSVPVVFSAPGACVPRWCQSIIQGLGCSVTRVPATGIAAPSAPRRSRGWNIATLATKSNNEISSAAPNGERAPLLPTASPAFRGHAASDGAYRAPILLLPSVVTNLPATSLVFAANQAVASASGKARAATALEMLAHESARRIGAQKPSNSSVPESADASMTCIDIPPSHAAASNGVLDNIESHVEVCKFSASIWLPYCTLVETAVVELLLAGLWAPDGRLLRARLAHPLFAAHLRRRLMQAGALGLLLAPLTLVFSVIYYGAQTLGGVKAGRGYLGPRKWSLAAMRTFRDYNELPHVLQRRLLPTFQLATQLLMLTTQARGPVTVIVARFVTVVLACFLSLLLLMGALDESILLYTTLSGRNLLWYAALVGGALTVVRSFAGDESVEEDGGGEVVTAPSRAMSRHPPSPPLPRRQSHNIQEIRHGMRRPGKAGVGVVAGYVPNGESVAHRAERLCSLLAAHTHISFDKLPAAALRNHDAAAAVASRWESLQSVRRALLPLFRPRIELFLSEVAGALTTPLILLFVLPARVSRILAFIDSHSVTESLVAFRSKRVSSPPTSASCADDGPEMGDHDDGSTEVENYGLESLGDVCCYASLRWRPPTMARQPSAASDRDVPHVSDTAADSSASRWRRSVMSFATEHPWDAAAISAAAPDHSRLPKTLPADGDTSECASAYLVPHASSAAYGSSVDSEDPFVHGTGNPSAVERSRWRSAISTAAAAAGAPWRGVSLR